MREFVDTTSFINADGELYEPSTPPEVFDPEDDEDSDLGADDAEDPTPL